MSTYIFILCPPYSGSTILWKLIATSPKVSSLPKEGQFIPEVREIMRKDPWNPDIHLPWQLIKAIWEGYWDQSKPFLVEKSPPNIIHTFEILDHFHPVYFLIMVRNPYAHCEGLIRRNKWSAQQAVEFSIHCLKQQIDNANALDNALCFTYEDLVGSPEGICYKIQDLIPNIGFLNYKQNFSGHAMGEKITSPILNMNQTNIDNLSPINLIVINRFLKKHPKEMKFWGYEYISFSSSQFIKYYWAKIIRLLKRILVKIMDGKSNLLN